MRSAYKRLGGNPASINPLVPVDLVIDHSVQVDYYGTQDARLKNEEKEFSCTLLVFLKQSIKHLTAFAYFVTSWFRTNFTNIICFSIVIFCDGN